MKTALFLTIFLALSTQVFATQSAIDCRTALQKNRARDFAEETALLATTAQKIQTLRKLSPVDNVLKIETLQKDSRVRNEDNSNVFKVTSGEGDEYVIRETSRGDSIDFEVFASAVIRSGPGVATPVVQKTKSHRGKKASLSRFYPMQGAREYLHAKAQYGLREALMHAANDKNGSGRLLLTPGSLHVMEIIKRDGTSAADQSLINRLDKNDTWAKVQEEAAKISLTQRLVVIAEMKSIFPETHYMADHDYFTQFAEFHKRLKSADKKRIIEIADRAWSKLPDSMQTQLANAWAYSVVLGMDDFNPGGWLVLDDTLLMVDLANRTLTFIEGAPRVEYTQNSPFNFYNLSPTLRAQMLAKISPDVREYLLNLTVDKIREIAKASDYILAGPQAEGMMNRARLLLTPVATTAP